jgi:ElaB/YqjD/DUF883 family membrane-anchored ribosome-binding protein
VSKSNEAQIRRMRAELDAVMKNTVAPAISDAFERAALTTISASERVQAHSNMVADGVRVRPLVSIIGAAAVGFAMGRLMRPTTEAPPQPATES